MDTETSTLHSALAAAQGEFLPIKRDKTVKVDMKAGGSYTFSYAPLESILHATTPALSKNGLALTQAPYSEGQQQYVETTLRHISGNSISNKIPIFVRDGGPQAYGSALTYARRYGVTLLLCVSADDDDDGNAAEGNQAQQVPRELSPSQTIGKRLVEALAAGLDGPVLEAWDEGMKTKDALQEAWELLTSDERKAINAILEKGKGPAKKSATQTGKW